MTLVRLDKRHRVTLPKAVRKRFRIVEGQKLYLVPFGDDLVMKSVPKDPSKELGRIIGDFRFGEESRRKAEKWLVKETAQKSSKR